MTSHQESQFSDFEARRVQTGLSNSQFSEKSRLVFWGLSYFSLAAEFKKKLWNFTENSTFNARTSNLVWTWGMGSVQANDAAKLLAIVLTAASLAIRTLPLADSCL